MSTDEGRPPGRMIERVRERKERHKQRGKIYRTLFAVAGVLVLLLGLVTSIPTVPGPGILLIVVGLGMLALEFDRAERLLEKILVRVEHLVDRALEAPLWQQILGALFTVAALVAGILVFVFWDVPVVPG